MVLLDFEKMGALRDRKLKQHDFFVVPLIAGVITIYCIVLYSVGGTCPSIWSQMYLKTFDVLF